MMPKFTKYQTTTLRELLREACILRDKHCLKCLKQRQLTTSHIYPKGRYKSIEYDLDNVKCLCVGCHLFWWHKNPILAKEWLYATLDPIRLQRLDIKARTVGRNRLDYVLTKLYLKDQILKFSD